MAKAKALKWNEFFAGSVVEKQEQSSVSKKALFLLSAGAALTISGVALVHGLPFIPDSSVTAFAHSAMTDPSLQAQLSAATKPIRDLINGFAHEIYFVFMSWGALEAMIGKPQQGFARMKTATFAYVLLFWVPWIVDKVSLVGPVGR